MMRPALEAGLALAKIHLLRRRIPLFVSWNVTFRCNLRCMYCAAHEAPKAELTAEEICDGLDALWERGTRWITFGGGEPLVLPYIGEIVRHAKTRGFQTYLSTNGSLLARKADDLKMLDHVTLSLDGNRAVHDQVRGTGAYDSVMEAIETCKALNLHTSLQCVLNQFNLDAVDEAVAIAAAHGLSIMFQPATKWLDSSLKPNPIAPETIAYRKAIARVTQLKKEGAPIRNSFTGLRHIACWPDPTPIFCVAGRVIAIIEPDGSMLACHQCQVGQFLQGKTVGGSLPEKFANMPVPGGCAQCWCAPLVELCLAFSLRPEAMLNAFRQG